MSVKRLAIFVEGQTEQIFVKQFLEEIAGVKNILFDCKVINAGVFTSLTQKTVSNAPAGHKYSVLLVNCQNDDRVKSSVLEHRDSLTNKGYSLILGLRDLYPKPYIDISKVEAQLKYRVPTIGVPTHILLSVAEIEAWFIQEYTHFAKIHRHLDPSTFKSDFGFDPFVDCAEFLTHPSKFLHEIYSSVGLAYHKSRKHVERTVKVLDYSKLYLELPGKVPYLSKFVDHIENFLSQ